MALTEAQARAIVEQQYADIGRTGFGTGVNQIDQGGYDYWVNQLTSGAMDTSKIDSAFDNAVSDYIAANPNDAYSQYVSSYINPTQTNTGIEGGGNYFNVPGDVVSPTATLGMDPATARQTVLNAYASIGRTGIGTDTSQVDQGGLDYWTNMLTSGQLSGQEFANSFNTEFQKHITSNPYGEYAQYYNEYLNQPTEAEQRMMDLINQANAKFGELSNFELPGVMAPTAVAAQAQAQGYTPETIAGQDMSKYMNPYTQEVIDQSLADLERQRQMQTNNLGFSATQAGAFGGSRHGVAEALTNEGFARQGGQLAANLRQAGYGQALATAGQDVGMMNQAGQFGAGAANQAALANAAAQTGVSQFNANTNLAAQQANQNAALAGAGMQMQAAQQQQGAANLGFNWQNTLNTNMFNQGLAQQQMNQQLINNAMQQYQMYQNQPNTSLGYMGTAMGAFPSMGTTTQTGSPSLLDILGTGLYGYGVLK